MSIEKFRLDLVGEIGKDWNRYSKVFGYVQNNPQNRKRVAEELSRYLRDIGPFYDVPPDQRFITLNALEFLDNRKLNALGTKITDVYRQDNHLPSLEREARKILVYCLANLIQSSENKIS